MAEGDQLEGPREGGGQCPLSMVLYISFSMYCTVNPQIRDPCTSTQPKDKIKSLWGEKPSRQKRMLHAPGRKELPMNRAGSSRDFRHLGMFSIRGTSGHRPSSCPGQGSRQLPIRKVLSQLTRESCPATPSPSRPPV